MVERVLQSRYSSDLDGALSLRFMYVQTLFGSLFINLDFPPTRIFSHP